MTPDTPRLHTGGFFFTNGWLMGAPDGVVAVDAPEGMADWLAGLGVKLKALLLTHWHLDHTADAARLAREHGCPIYAWGPSTPEDRLETHLKQWAGITYTVEPYPVDVALAGYFEDEKQPGLTVAGRAFRLEHVPGHSPDSVVFIDEAAGLVFSGDTLMQGGIGRSDFPGGDGELLVQGIRGKILTLPADWRVFSGHGRTTTVGAELRGNSFLM